MDLKETIYINKLLDLYGNLLSKSQHEIMVDYYEANLSLSEISEIRSISRTAVSDALKKGRNNLIDYEKKLNFCKAFDAILQENDANKSNVIKQIEEMIKNGI